MNFTNRLNKIDLDEFSRKRKEKHDKEMRELFGRAPTDPCHACGSKRIATISADGKDYSSLDVGGVEQEGYLPNGIGIGPGGGEIDFSYCLKCGQIQGGEFPISKKTVKKALKEMDPRYDGID